MLTPSRYSPQDRISRVGFGDLYFAQALVVQKSSSGDSDPRWLDVGMPRIDQDFFKHVFYLFRLHPKTGEVEGPCGTGCIIVLDSQVRGHDHYYAVSNWHVVARKGASIIRLNTKEGKTHPIEFDPSEWVTSQDDDLAIIDITDKISQKRDDARCFGLEMFATKDVISDKEIGPGDDVFMIGLFANYDGGERNKPCARFGNISMLAQDDALVPQENGPAQPRHLVDMRSRTGFSGSPVYVYRTPSSDIRAANSGKWNLNVKDNLFLHFLGVHSGQFREPINARKGSKANEIIGDPIKEGDELLIPSSMTMVVPAWRVRALMDDDKLAEQREKRDARNRQFQDKIPYSESIAPEHETTASHKERFNQLLGAAVKPTKSSDQT